MTTRALWTRTTIALILGIVMVVVCYFFVDQPVAWFVHHHGVAGQELSRWAERLSGWLQDLTILVIPFVVLWRLWKPGGRFQAVLWVLAVDLIATYALKWLAKWACGRYWPEAWDQQGHSWLGTGDYGFHPFHFGPAYQSFPSGHAAMVFSVAAVLWFGYPRGRWCYALVCAAISLGLVGLNYHFVGDVVGGAVLGAITGVWVWHFFQRRAKDLEPGDWRKFGIRENDIAADDPLRHPISASEFRI